MSEFEPAVEATLTHEGGYANNPNDRGGETNFGISRRFLKSQGIPCSGSLRLLTREHAVRLYRQFFWEKLGLQRLDSQLLASKVFDVAVNMGPRRAVLLLQEACCALGSTVEVDGRLGPITVAAANALDPQTLVNSLCRLQAQHYRHIVDADPTQHEFLHGWLKRANFGRFP